MADVRGGRIIWELDVKDSGFAGKMAAASAQAKGLADSAKGTGSKLQAEWDRAGSSAATLLKTLAAVGAGIAAAGVFAVKSAANYEQSRIAFDTMLGSADLGRKKLAELSEFARKTPFELPQVVEGAKRLLAYGISADKLIPTFSALGNIAAGVGRDKLPQLVVAFGQVQTAGRLTGMELRQFTEAGVPLLEVLAKQSGKTAAQVKDDMERGMAPSFEDVEKAIFSMSQEGGKFFNLMERQSKSFSGTMSNIVDNIGRTARNIVGISDTGDIREGSLFAHLKKGAEGLLKFLDANQGKIVGFFDTVSRVVSNAGPVILAALGILAGPIIARIFLTFGSHIRNVIGFWQTLVTTISGGRITPSLMGMGLALGIVGVALAAFGMAAIGTKMKLGELRATSASLDEQIAALNRQMSTMAPGEARTKLEAQRKALMDQQQAVDQLTQRYSGLGGVWNKIMDDLQVGVDRGVGIWHKFVVAFTKAQLAIAESNIVGLWKDKIPELQSTLDQLEGKVQAFATRVPAEMKGSIAAELIALPKVFSDPVMKGLIDAQAQAGGSIGQLKDSMRAKFGEVPPAIESALAGLDDSVSVNFAAAKLAAMQNSDLMNEYVLQNFREMPGAIGTALSALPSVMHNVMVGSIVRSGTAAGISVGQLKENLRTQFGLIPPDVAAALANLDDSVKLNMDAAGQAGYLGAIAAKLKATGEFAKLPPEVQKLLEPTVGAVEDPLARAADAAGNQGIVAVDAFTGQMVRIDPLTGQVLGPVPGTVGRELDSSGPAGSAGRAAIDAFVAGVGYRGGRIQGPTITLAVKGESAEINPAPTAHLFAKGGFVQGFASGGPVYAKRGLNLFKRRGTDTVPAMLTPGEFVMSTKGVRTVGDFLENLNSGVVPEVSASGGSGSSINISVRLEGVFVKSRQEMREAGKELIESVNEELRSRGADEIGGGALATV